VAEHVLAAAGDDAGHDADEVGGGRLEHEEVLPAEVAGGGGQGGGAVAAHAAVGGAGGVGLVDDVAGVAAEDDREARVLPAEGLALLGGGGGDEAELAGAEALAQLAGDRVDLGLVEQLAGVVGGLDGEAVADREVVAAGIRRSCRRPYREAVPDRELVQLVHAHALADALGGVAAHVAVLAAGGVRIAEAADVAVAAAVAGIAVGLLAARGLAGEAAGRFAVAAARLAAARLGRDVIAAGRGAEQRAQE
jgi:hypothetical protein